MKTIFNFFYKLKKGNYLDFNEIVVDSYWFLWLIFVCNQVN